MNNANHRTLETRQALLAAILVVAATIAVFLPAIKSDFVGLDDDVYITANRLIAPLTGERGGATDAGKQERNRA